MQPQTYTVRRHSELGYIPCKSPCVEKDGFGGGLSIIALLLFCPSQRIKDVQDLLKTTASWAGYIICNAVKT